MPSSDYWWGVGTLPIIAAVGFGCFVAWVLVIEELDARFGVSFTTRWTRDKDGISDYTLRNDIWWERSFGPVFVGGWYREPPRYGDDAPELRLFNRWIGIGRADGPCFMAFRKRVLP